jgi:hypothetical protein
MGSISTTVAENPGPSGQNAAPQLVSYRFAAVLAICIAGYVVLVATQTMVFGWNMGGWSYSYVQGFKPTPLIVGFLLAATAAACDRWIPPRMGLVFWFVAGTAGQIVLHSFMFDRSLNDMVTSMGFYEVVNSTALHDILGRFRELRGSWPRAHPGANMPGMLMLYKGIEVFVINPTVIALLSVLLSNLGAILLYLIVESVYGSRQLALRSSVLYLFIPARIYFLPILNTLSPLPILFALLMLIRFLCSGRVWFALLTGVALYASVLFDPETLALGFFFIAVIVKFVRVDRIPVSRLGRLAIFGAAGFAAVYVLMRIVYGFDLLSAIYTLFAANKDFNAARDRPYSSWLFGNQYELFMGAGLLATICCFTYLAVALVGSDLPMSLAQTSFLVCLFGTIAVLVIAGVMRGEVSRLWIFLMVFMQVVAADFCGRFWPYVYRIVLAGAIIQTAISTAMVGWVG